MDPAAPGHQPAHLVFASMAYDAATSNVVLFGGENPKARLLGDTWTWG